MNPSSAKNAATEKIALQLSEVGSEGGVTSTRICRLTRSVTKEAFADRKSAGATVVACELSRKVTSSARSPNVTCVTPPDSTRWMNSENAICGGAAGRRTR